MSEGKKCFVIKVRCDFVFVKDFVNMVVIVVDGKGKGVYYFFLGIDVVIKEFYDVVVVGM